MALLFLFTISLIIISVFYIKVYRHIYKVSCHQRYETINGRKDSQISNAAYSVNSRKNRLSIAANSIEKYDKSKLK